MSSNSANVNDTSTIDANQTAAGDGIQNPEWLPRKFWEIDDDVFATMDAASKIYTVQRPLHHIACIFASRYSEDRQTDEPTEFEADERVESLLARLDVERLRDLVVRNETERRATREFIGKMEARFFKRCVGETSEEAGAAAGKGDGRRSGAIMRQFASKLNGTVLGKANADGGFTRELEKILEGFKADPYGALLSFTARLEGHKMILRAVQKENDRREVAEVEAIAERFQKKFRPAK